MRAERRVSFSVKENKRQEAMIAMCKAEKEEQDKEKEKEANNKEMERHEPQVIGEKEKRDRSVQWARRQRQNGG
jgi:hypothetical protein